MKNIKILLLLNILISNINIQAQYYPLNTFVTEIPNYSYIKDTENKLSQFVGEYHANDSNKLIKLFLTKVDHKEINRLGSVYFSDVIMVKFTIVNGDGIILQNTYNTPMTDKVNKIQSFYYDFNIDELALSYSGTNCGVGWGVITLKKINDTQFQWIYKPNDTSLINCPENSDLTIYLPKTKNLIFTKK